MSQEIIAPFALTPSGGIAATSDPAVMTQQHVDSLVSTRPGERAMNPTYGVDVSGLLFGQSASIVQQSLLTDVQKAMAVFEPGVSVIKVTPTNLNDPIDGIVSLEVDYRTIGPGGSSSPTTSTFTVLVGGTVVETAN